MSFFRGFGLFLGVIAVSFREGIRVSENSHAFFAKFWGDE